MASASELIRNRGQVILNKESPWTNNPIWESLNRHQRLMVRGWLGKGRVTTVEEGLEKILKRIEKDSQQGKV